MKKTLILFALASMLLTGTGIADTVTITSLASFSTPEGGSIESTGTFAFRGPEAIVFKVAGKTCTLKGSALGSPNGCNYSITVRSDGTITGVLKVGSSTCTQTPAIPSQCR